MTTPYVFQWLRPDEVKRRLNRICAPQGTPAYFSGLSDCTFSLYLSDKKALSEQAQIDLSFALNFMEDLARKAAPLPVDFSNIEVLEPLFIEYRRQRLESEVLRTEAELAETT